MAANSHERSGLMRSGPSDFVDDLLKAFVGRRCAPHQQFQQDIVGISEQTLQNLQLVSVQHAISRDKSH
jgi:hypothetical protein